MNNDFYFDGEKSVSNQISDVFRNCEYEEKHTTKFGITFLDDLFGGLSPKDLMLIGGGTGGGKTQMAVAIASEAALQKKRVIYFALEAENNEIASRLLYRKFSKWFFDHKLLHGYGKDVLISYDRFARNEPKQFIEKFKSTNECNLNEFDTLKTKYFDSGFTIEHLKEKLIEIENRSDLIVIDHLHYFDLLSENENKETKEIIKLIRNYVLEKSIPVILVAHIRKQNEMIQKLTPSADDYHGTSDVVKIATKAINIASCNDIPIGYACEIEGKPAFQEIDIDGGGTFIRAVKFRRNGSVVSYTILSKFDSKTTGYGENYYVGKPHWFRGKICFNGAHKENIPSWAERAISIK